MILEKQTRIPSYDGVELYLRTAVPKAAQAILIMVHGMCEHSGRYRYMMERLSEAGIGVCCYDLRGHGLSEGGRCHYDSADQLTKDTQAVMAWIQKEYPDCGLFIGGYSMGGLAAADIGTRFPDGVKGIILLAGATRDVYGGFARVDPTMDPHTRFKNTIGYRMTEDDSVREDYQSDPLVAPDFTAGLNQQMAMAVEKLKARTDFSLPVLLLHGEKDRLVSPEDSLLFFKEVASEDKKLILYGNAGHALLEEKVKAEVCDDMVNWIRRRL